MNEKRKKKKQNDFEGRNQAIRLKISLTAFYLHRTNSVVASLIEFFHTLAAKSLVQLQICSLILNCQQLFFRGLTLT